MEELQRKYEGKAGLIISILSIVMMLWAIISVLDVFGYISTITPLRLFVFPGQHLALFLGFSLVLTFLLVPATKRSLRPTSYDWVLVVFSAVSMLYLFLNWGRVEYEVYKEATWYETILAGMAIISVLEATRRTVGLTVTILVMVFIIYPLVSAHLPGPLMGKGYSLARLMQEFYLGIGALFGVPLQMIARIAAMFVLFEEFFNMTGAGKIFIDGAFALFGHVRGGPAKVAVVSSGLFGTISGSPIANVVTTGTFSIPLMKKIGYPPHFAGAVEAAASTGGGLLHSLPHSPEPGKKRNKA